MKRLFILLTFLVLTSCLNQSKISSSFKETSNAVIGEGTPYTPISGQVFKHITLDLIKPDGSILSRSTLKDNNIGVFEVVEGDYQFKISYETVLKDHEYIVELELKSINNQEFIKEIYKSTNVNTSLTPGMYLIEARIQHVNIPELKLSLEPSLIVKCEGEAESFTVNPSRIQVTPMCEKSSFSNIYKTYNANHISGNCYNFGMHRHDLSNAVTSNTSLNDFHAYYDCDGDGLYDYLSHKPITQAVECYSNFASRKKAHYRIVNKCGEYKDVEVDLTTSIRSQIKNTYETVEKEDGNIQTNASYLSLLKKEPFIQSTLTSNVDDKRVNGTLSFIDTPTNENVEIKCSFENTKLLIEGLSIEGEKSSTISKEVTGFYSTHLNFTGVTQNSSDKSYNVDNLNFDSIRIDIPGLGDVKVDDTISSNNCNFNIAMDKTTTTANCEAGYSGQIYTHKYKISLDYNCTDLWNKAGSIQSQIPKGEMYCEPAQAQTEQTCTRLSCNCQLDREEDSGIYCENLGRNRLRKYYICEKIYDHCKDFSTLESCQVTTPPPTCTCTSWGPWTPTGSQGNCQAGFVEEISTRTCTGTVGCPTGGTSQSRCVPSGISGE